MVSDSSLCWASSSFTPASRIFSIRRGILEFSCASNKFGGNRKLVGGDAHRFPRRSFVHSRHFKHDSSRLDHRNPLFRSAFAFAHAGFRGLLGERLIRENPDPQFAAALDKPRNGHAGSFNLAVGDPGIFHGLQTVFAECQRTAAPGFAPAASAHLLSILHLLGHQHRCILASVLCATAKRSPDSVKFFSLPRPPRAFPAPGYCASERFRPGRSSTSRR